MAFINRAGAFETRAACPVCGDTAAREIYRCPMTDTPVRDFITSHYRSQGEVDWSLLEGADFALAECGRCALVYQVHIPGPSLLETIYTRFTSKDFLAKHERELLTIDNFAEVAGELVRLFRLVRKAPAEVRFLDYGFGYGRWARVARALGATVFATEIGEDKLKAARDLGVIPIPDGEVDAMRFDIVHTEQVFEHLTHPGRDFSRLASATSGVLKVAVPRSGPVAAVLARRGMSPQSPIIGMLETGKSMRGDALVYAAIQPLEHLNAFAPRTMEWLAAHNRMRIVSRERSAAVMIEPDDVRRLARGARRFGKEVARRIIKPHTGYFLFQPEER